MKYSQFASTSDGYWCQMKDGFMQSRYLLNMYKWLHMKDTVCFLLIPVRIQTVVDLMLRGRISGHAV